MITASERALSSAKPFNRFLTVHFSAVEISDSVASQATAQFIKLASDFMHNRNTGPLTYAWVRENDEGNSTKGSHVHILLHVPPDLAPAWRKRQAGWIASIIKKYRPAKEELETLCADNPRTGRRKGAVLTRNIGGKLTTCFTNPALWEANIKATLAYVLKGATLETLATLQISHASESGGIVIGKRAGWWQGRVAVVKKWQGCAGLGER